jgi:hypothetical protein
MGSSGGAGQVKRRSWVPVERQRMRLLDGCLELLEDALARGQVGVDAGLARQLYRLLGDGGLVPDQRLEGRRVERVLDDVFALQAQLLGQEEERLPRDSRRGSAQGTVSDVTKRSSRLSVFGERT